MFRGLRTLCRLVLLALVISFPWLCSFVGESWTPHAGRGVRRIGRGDGSGNREWSLMISAEEAATGLTEQTMAAAATLLNSTGFVVLQGASLFTELELQLGQETADVELAKVKSAAERLDLLERSPWATGLRNSSQYATSETCPRICVSIYPSFYLPTYLLLQILWSVCLWCAERPMAPTVTQIPLTIKPVYLSIYLSDHISLCPLSLSLCLSRFRLLSFSPSLSLSVCLPLWPSACLSDCLPARTYLVLIQVAYDRRLATSPGKGPQPAETIRVPRGIVLLPGTPGHATADWKSRATKIEVRWKIFEMLWNLTYKVFVSIFPLF